MRIPETQADVSSIDPGLLQHELEQQMVGIPFQLAFQQHSNGPGVPQPGSWTTPPFELGRDEGSYIGTSRHSPELVYFGGECQ